MTPVTLQVPDAFMTIPSSERNQIFLSGLYAAIRSHIRQLNTEILQAESQVRRFEKNYNASLQEFETNVLPTANSWEVHDDYNDWFFWQSLLDKKSQLLQELQSESLLPA